MIAAESGETVRQSGPQPRQFLMAKKRRPSSGPTAQRIKHYPPNREEPARLRTSTNRPEHKGRKTVSQAIADIRDFHDKGRQIFKLDRDRLPGVKAGDLVAAVNVNNLDMMEKARLFAQQYSAEDLHELCRRIKSGGFPLGVQHIVRLLRLPDKQRPKYLDQTIRKKWSCRALGAAIQNATGRQPHAGRRIRVLDRTDALGRLIAECYHWRRLIIAITATGDGRKHSIAATLPETVQLHLEQCDRKIATLHRGLQDVRMSR